MMSATCHRNLSFGIHDALNQAMDSRFRGNDVIIEREPSLPPTTTVIPAVSVTRLLHKSKDPLLPRSNEERAPRRNVIPAEAGIHYGQRIPKLELS